jgi:hypothetical protein
MYTSLRKFKFALLCRQAVVAFTCPIMSEAGFDRQKLIALLWNIKARLFKRNFLYVLRKTLNFPSARNKDARLVYKDYFLILWVTTRFIRPALSFGLLVFYIYNKEL